MGNKIISLARRPFRNYNIESRAHKIISQDKPMPAPRHESEKIDIERALKDYPEVYEESLKKNQVLDKYLRDVYVKSHDTNKEIPNDPQRPLPLNRNRTEDFEYGIKEPEKVSIGKITLRNALKFITQHQENAKINSSEKISQDTQIPEETIKNVLKYFKVFEVYIPQQRSVKAKFAGPSVPRIKLVSNQQKQLGSGLVEKLAKGEAISKSD